MPFRAKNQRKRQHQPRHFAGKPRAMRKLLHDAEHMKKSKKVIWESEVVVMKSIWSVTLHVSNLEKSREFYQETLGLNKKYEYPSYIGFECSGVEIGLIPRDKLEIGKEAPSIQFLVESVDKTCQTLKEKGVELTVDPHDEPWGGRQARFLDPDGNTLELTQIDWKKYFKIASEGA